ncbi:hypothetical protein [Castellaniella sp.]|uniref:hypothetical protein n=1 Tax=Castellaniella sp. TaxID=1955812 RepID=UPI002AFF32BC|nr:hypothetical protein [Castellaniella sp.]
MVNPYFNAQYYLNNNPDVAAVVGLSSQGAWDHYIAFGANEGRKPAPWFDSQFYLADNPDLIDAGLTVADLFSHFTTFGINEGRAPSASAQLTPANLLAYALANPDLQTAFGIDSKATSLTDAQQDQLANQFYAFGYEEGRPGAPFDSNPDAGQTFTLTNAVGEVVNGTIGNDTFYAVLGDGTVTTSTLNMGDQIDGVSGNDVLNLAIGAGATGIPAGVKIANIDTVNLDVSAAAAAGTILSAASYAGVQNLNQISNGAANFGAVTAASGVEVGFSSANAQVIAAAATVNFGATATEGTVNLNGVGSTSNVVLNAAAPANAKLGTLHIDGNLNVVAGTANSTLNVDLNSLAKLTTLDVDLTSNTNVVIADAGKLKVIDGADSSGNLAITAAQASFTALTALSTGSGNDQITITAAAAGKALEVDAGAGADAISVSAITATTKAFSLTGGDGADTFVVAGTNVGATIADFVSTVKVTDFGVGADNLDLTSFTGAKVANTTLQAQVNSIDFTGMDLVGALTAVGALTNANAAGNNVVTHFLFEGNTYVYVDEATTDGFNAGDMVIELAGDVAANLAGHILLA